MNRFFYLSPLILQTAIWPITRQLFRFFVRLEVCGLENLLSYTNHPRTRDICVDDPKPCRENCGVIFAVNHSSELDPILVPASLPFLSPLMPFFYTSRDQAFYKTSEWRQFFYGGFLFQLWGSHPVHSGKQSYEESLRTHIEILNKGHSVCIFPEGRKTKDGALGTEAHGGVAYLAYRTDAPVVPVRTKGVFKMTLGDFLFRKRFVEIVFGKPFTSAELFPRDETPSLAEIKTAANRILGAIRQL